MTEIKYGIHTDHIQAAAAMIIGYYFDYNDYGENLKAYNTNNKDRLHLSNPFGDRDFIHFEWEGPNTNGIDQVGEANAIIFAITNGKHDEARETAIRSLLNFGDYCFGYREVLSINEEHVDDCAKLFNEKRIQDIVHFVRTQKTDMSKQSRVYVRTIPWSERTSRYEFVILSGEMGYGW